MKSQCTDEKIHELFSLNRWEYRYVKYKNPFLIKYRDKILKNINQGIHTIVDRYAYSGVAYSTAKVIKIFPN